MSKRIACVITDMFEDVEYTDPVKAYKEAGHEVVTIGFERGQTVEGKNGKEKVEIQQGIDEVKAEEFDALFIPGGFSPDLLRGDERFVSFTKAFMDAKIPVFAICHGPQLLITAKALEGRDAAGYKSIKVDIENAGSIDAFLKNVVVEGDEANSEAIKMSYEVKNNDETTQYAVGSIVGNEVGTNNSLASSTLLNKKGDSTDYNHLYVTLEYLESVEGVTLGEEATYTLNLYYEQTDAN